MKRYSTKEYGGHIHMIRTEVEDFDEALDILFKNRPRVKQPSRPRSLRQQFLADRGLKASLAVKAKKREERGPKPAHPFQHLHDLSHVEKKASMILAYDEGRGPFKPAELARMYKVSCKIAKSWCWGKDWRDRVGDYHKGHRRRIARPKNG